MKITFEINDDDLRRVLAPLFAKHATSPPNGTDRLLDMTQVREQLGVSPSKVKKMTRFGELPAVRIGRRVFVRQSDLQAFIDSRQIDV
jgi:excisionase family DNA binding protein